MSLTKWLRFADLRERGIIPSWPMLRRRVALDGFPPGRKLGPNTRAWSKDEVEAWLSGRRGYKRGWAAHKFKEKFGHFPPWNYSELAPAAPTDAVLRWIKSRNIAFAKAQRGAA